MQRSYANELCNEVISLWTEIKLYLTLYIYIYLIIYFRKILFSSDEI